MISIPLSDMDVNMDGYTIVDSRTSTVYMAHDVIMDVYHAGRQILVGLELF